MTDVMMKGFNQEDYDARKQRQNDGVASDEDRRLIKLYEREGFEQTRLKQEREAKEAGRHALQSGDEPEDSGEATPGKITQRNTVEEWRSFASTVNGKLAEADRPIGNDALPDATKTELMDAYRGFAQAANTGA